MFRKMIKKTYFYNENYLEFINQPSDIIEKELK